MAYGESGKLHLQEFSLFFPWSGKVGTPSTMSLPRDTWRGSCLNPILGGGTVSMAPIFSRAFMYSTTSFKGTGPYSADTASRISCELRFPPTKLILSHKFFVPPLIHPYQHPRRRILLVQLHRFHNQFLHTGPFHIRHAPQPDVSHVLALTLEQFLRIR